MRERVTENNVKEAKIKDRRLAGSDIFVTLTQYLLMTIRRRPSRGGATSAASRAMIEHGMLPCVFPIAIIKN